MHRAYLRDMSVSLDGCVCFQQVRCVLVAGNLPELDSRQERSPQNHLRIYRPVPPQQGSHSNRTTQTFQGEETA